MKAEFVAQDRLLQPPEVAERLGVTVGYLATRRFERKGPAFIKIGAAVRYRESAIAEWLDSNTHNRAEGTDA